MRRTTYASFSDAGLAEQAIDKLIGWPPQLPERERFKVGSPEG